MLVCCGLKINFIMGGMDDFMMFLSFLLCLM